MTKVGISLLGVLALSVSAAIAAENSNRELQVPLRFKVGRSDAGIELTPSEPAAVARLSATSERALFRGVASALRKSEKNLDINQALMTSRKILLGREHIGKAAGGSPDETQGGPRVQAFSIPFDGCRGIENHHVSCVEEWCVEYDCQWDGGDVSCSCSWSAPTLSGGPTPDQVACNKSCGAFAPSTGTYAVCQKKTTPRLRNTCNDRCDALC